MEFNKIHILYFDQEPNNLNALTAWFRRNVDYECHVCSREEEASYILNHYPIKILLVDQSSKESTGIGSWVQIPAGSPDPIKIVLTAHRDLSLLDKAVNECVIHAYMSKPIDFAELEKLIKTVGKTEEHF